MPYIRKEDREKLDKYIAIMDEAVSEDLESEESANTVKGNYNYAITRLMHLYIKRFGLNYSNLSNVNGILNDVIAEFNRKVVGPYEDKKILENGDINVL